LFEKKKMVALLLAIIAFISTIGCQSDPLAEEQDSSETILYDGIAYPKMNGSGTVQVLAHADTFGLRKTVLQEVYGIQIDYQLVPYEQIPKEAEIRIHSGQSLDLVYYTSREYPLGMAKGIYLPLEDFLDFGNPVWRNSKKNADQFRYQGKIYMVPELEHARYIWYNPVLFKKHGLKTPLEQYKAGEWTWEWLKEATDVLRKSEDKLYAIAGSVYGAVMASKGRKFIHYTPDGFRNATLDPEVEESIDFVNALYGQDRFLATQSEALPVFLKEQTALLYEGAWIYSRKDMQKLIREKEIGFLPTPRWKDQEEHIYLADAIGYLIPTTVQNLDGALAALTANQIIGEQKAQLDDYCQTLMEVGGLSKECVDIYKALQLSDIKYASPECSIFENPKDSWLPFDWMNQGNARSWNFVKRRVYYHFNDGLERFNAVYG